MEDGEWSVLALTGHVDDPMTWMAWVLALDGNLNELNAIIGDRGIKKGSELLDLFDGLDGNEIVGCLKAAYHVVDLMVGKAEA